MPDPSAGRTRWVVLALLLIGSGCRHDSSRQEATIAYAPDPHSFARPAEARVTHIALDLSPDFAAHRLRGTARLTVERTGAADRIVLDIRDLTIKKLTDGSGRQLEFEIGVAKPFLGQPLTVKLPARVDTIAIEYETSPQAAAVQWLAPEQTAGRKTPFLFTQGESILTRTWVPTQDSPGIRQTYDAVIHAPAGMRAVMSAERIGADGETDAQGSSVFRFRMDKRIPPYLMALAVGDLAFRPIGPTTGVYAEPLVATRAANEFAEVDQMIAAAVKLYGPYRWGRYDILVLPPSFPFGGMENPTLTFATPTLLAGDRSLVSVVAHELAHSWSGNLVTNATWDDFWINEGFTTYAERRIMEELRGKRYADMLLELGREDLQQAIADAGGPQSPDTRLHLDLRGRDPDDGTTQIPYEKGSAFLQTVESVVGRARLDAFLRGYFDHFAFQPMTSERLIAYMKEHLLTGDEATRVNVQAWVYDPGLPANLPPVHSDAFDAVDAQIKTWNTGAPVSTLLTRDWTSHEWLHFLHGLPPAVPQARLAALDRAFHLSDSGNSEILDAWLLIAIRNHYQPAFPALDRFLTSQGRRKFLKPLYQELAKTGWGLALARDIYRRVRPTYHSVAVNTIDQILKWQS